MFVSGGFQNISTLKRTILSYLFAIDIVCSFYLGSRGAPVDYMALKYNLGLPWVMSFLLTPHLPRLVTWEWRSTVANRQKPHKFIYKFGATTSSGGQECHILKTIFDLPYRVILNVKITI